VFHVGGSDTTRPSRHGLLYRSGLGPGPRDGLMLEVATRGHSVRSVRTLVELSVLAVGVVLGDTVSIGTVAYALAIGPIVHFSLPRFTLARPTKPVMQKGEV